MTALQEFHEDMPVEPAVDGTPHGRLSETTPPAEAAVTQLPVSPAPVPSRLLAGDGMRLVAGLTWETASGPEAPVLRRGAPCVLRLPDRRARLECARDGSCGSLLLAMAAELTAIHVPGASGPWAFIAELPEPDDVPTIMLAVADIAAPGEEGDGTGAGEGVSRYVTPRPGPESMFDDPDDALAALQELLDITDIAGLAVRWLPGRQTRRGRMIAGIAEIAETLELHDVGPEAHATSDVDRDAASSVRLPAFVPPRRVPIRLVGALAAGAGTLLAGVFVVLPMVEAALRPPPPPPPEMVSVQVAPGAFAAACTDVLDAWWPRITGWRVASAGCAMAGHLPGEPELPQPSATERLGRPLAIWRHLVPEPGRNQVLARSAAEQMIASWPHEARLDAGRVTLWRTAILPLARADASAGGTSRPDPDAVRARLAALWADSPGAVSRPDEGRVTGLFRIGTSGATPTDALLSRAARVPGIAPVRLVRAADGTGELVLAPVSPREVPKALFEGTGG